MGISSGTRTLKFLESHQYKILILRRKISFSPERRSKGVKFAKNDRLDALFVLPRDDQSLFFPWKWFKGGTIGLFFSHFLTLCLSSNIVVFVYTNTFWCYSWITSAKSISSLVPVFFVAVCVVIILLMLCFPFPYVCVCVDQLLCIPYAGIHPFRSFNRVEGVPLPNIWFQLARKVDSVGIYSLHVNKYLLKQLVKIKNVICLTLWNANYVKWL